MLIGMNKNNSLFFISRYISPGPLISTSKRDIRTFLKFDTSSTKRQKKFTAILYLVLNKTWKFLSCKYHKVFFGDLCTYQKFHEFWLTYFNFNNLINYFIYLQYKVWNRNLVFILCRIINYFNIILTKKYITFHQLSLIDLISIHLINFLVILPLLKLMIANLSL